MAINSTDAVKITRRFVGSDTVYLTAGTSAIRADWNFEKSIGGDTINVSPTLNDTIKVSGSNIVQDIKGICLGDVTGSNQPLPGAKTQSKVQLKYNEVKRLNSDEYFEMPIKVTNDISIGAISLILKYPKELVTIDNLQLIIDNELDAINQNMNLFYKVNGDELRIGWFEEDEAINLKNNESFIIIRGKTSSNFKAGDEINFRIKNDALCELADENGDPIENVTLNTYSIEHINTLKIGTVSNKMTNDMILYPNPAENIANIKYKIANDGFVNISLYNVFGEKVVDFVNKPELKGIYNKEINLTSLSSGVYMCKMVLDGKSVIVKRLVVSK
jgi:hypothetical protein